MGWRNSRHRLERGKAVETNRGEIRSIDSPSTFLSSNAMNHQEQRPMVSNLLAVTCCIGGYEISPSSFHVWSIGNDGCSLQVVWSVVMSYGTVSTLDLTPGQSLLEPLAERGINY